MDRLCAHIGISLGRGGSAYRAPKRPCLALLLLLFHHAASAAPSPARLDSSDTVSTQRIEFRRTVVNLEYSVYDLKHASPTGAKAPETSGDLSYGSIMRRLPGEDMHASSHYIEFCSSWERGVAVRAWCDRNGNHDFTDDVPVTLTSHPRSASSRSFLVDLQWAAAYHGREYPIQEKVRVVLEPNPSNGRPQARVQQVYGMLGSCRIQSVARPAVLFDGNGDGLYGPEFGDGLFLDLDGDHHFDIDPMGPDFVPLSVSVPVAGHRYRAGPIDPEGRWVELQDLGPVDVQPSPQPGARAPDFEAVGQSGERLRLSDFRGRWTVLYFWASWCGNCAAQAPGLHELIDKHPRVAVLGISYDTERSEMERFRATYQETWPTTFSGRMLWEDPVGRLYRVDGPGLLCLIQPDGTLDGMYENPSDVIARLDGRSVGVAGGWHDAVKTGKGGQR